MRNLLSSFLIVLFLLASTAGVSAQQVYTYAERTPQISHSKAVFGSEITIQIREAPPGSVVWFNMSLIEEGVESISDLSEPDLGGINSNLPFWHEAAVVDQQGRAFFDIPLRDRPDWMGKTVLFKAYIKDNSLEGNSYLLPMIFSVDNPELCIPSSIPDVGGRISKFDELDGRLIAEIPNLGGVPRKIVFTKDSRLGFAMLDEDRIAIFSNPENRLITTQKTGLGLVDIAVTPDSNKLIALTRGVRSPTADPYAAVDPYATGELWIYNVETVSDPQRYNNPIRCHLDRILADGEGDLLAVGEDSTLLAIRQGGMLLGCYNLISNQYSPFEIGKLISHFRAEIKDIKVIGNRLLALVGLPDGSSELHMINLQNYNLHRSFSVGGGAERILMFKPEGYQPMAVLLDHADDRCDYLMLIDIYSDNQPLQVSVPDGIIDYDVTETCGLCMVLFQEENHPVAGDRRTALVGFIDLYRLRLLPEMISLELDGAAHVLMSRADCSQIGYSQMGYVYTEHGVLTQIDLETFQIVEQVRINGTCSGPVIEIY